MGQLLHFQMTSDTACDVAGPHLEPASQAHNRHGPRSQSLLREVAAGAAEPASTHSTDDPSVTHRKSGEQVSWFVTMCTEGEQLLLATVSHVNCLVPLPSMAGITA